MNKRFTVVVSYEVSKAFVYDTLFDSVAHQFGGELFGFGAGFELRDLNYGFDDEKLAYDFVEAVKKIQADVHFTVSGVQPN